MSAAPSIEPRRKRATRQDYETPPEFIEAVEKRFGTLAFDLACTAGNRKADLWYDDDALARSWAEDTPRGNLWLNPPFEHIAPWAKKCAEESANRRGLILILTPASIGSKWFERYVLGKAYVLGLFPRLTFVGETAPYPKDLMLSAYGYGLHGFDTWNWGGAR